jgi:hypothetical protein
MDFMEHMEQVEGFMDAPVTVCSVVIGSQSVGFSFMIPSFKDYLLLC